VYSAVTNAQNFIKIKKNLVPSPNIFEFTSINHHQPKKTLSFTPLSDEISKDLKKEALNL
jgi:3-methyladenine DNA glycosylase Tag